MDSFDQQHGLTDAECKFFGESDARSIDEQWFVSESVIRRIIFSY